MMSLEEEIFQLPDPETQRSRLLRFAEFIIDVASLQVPSPTNDIKPGMLSNIS